MTEVIFPKEWWKMTKDEYNNGLIALKALLNTRDLEVGIKEVSKVFESLEREEKRRGEKRENLVRCIVKRSLFKKVSYFSLKQLKYVDKTLPKLHSSILYVQGQLSEKEAKEVFEAKTGLKSSIAKQATPKRSLRQVQKWRQKSPKN
jgi:hypothetical protein